jgi:hypothetical protein
MTRGLLRQAPNHGMDLLTFMVVAGRAAGPEHFAKGTIPMISSHSAVHSFTSLPGSHVRKRSALQSGRYPDLWGKIMLHHRPARTREPSKAMTD